MPSQDRHYGITKKLNYIDSVHMHAKISSLRNKKTKNKTHPQTLCYVIEKSFLHFEQAWKASYAAKVSFADSGPYHLSQRKSLI